MKSAYANAFILGYERMAAWSDLLDQINVFPVPDSDTGRNLKISLAALRRLGQNPDLVSGQILKAATGNSGNIAVAFMRELLKNDETTAFAGVIQKGAKKAKDVVPEPKPGTMLTLFEVLAQAVAPFENPPSQSALEIIIEHLEKCVSDTCQALPELRQAGVVDAGALGMFIFLEAFLYGLVGCIEHSRPIPQRFKGKLELADGWRFDGCREQYCVTALIRQERGQSPRHLAGLGNSLVVNESEGLLKVHLHTKELDTLRSGLDKAGQVLEWSEEKIDLMPGGQGQNHQSAHIMTDAAGSVTLEDARTLAMTLLESYLVVGEHSYPEALYRPGALYAAMLDGQKVSTAQASIYQRHQSYLSAVSRFQRVIYLCVGSAYTGNFETARLWQATNVLGPRLTIIDSGAASGRLGIVALAAASYAKQNREPEDVVRFAKQALTQSRELVFLDQLKYLAASGRLSRTGGFFGDLLHMKPIITPSADGAKKVGSAYSRDGQLAFALKELQSSFAPGEAPLILLQYSDNLEWVEKIAEEKIRPLLPAARILLRPLSLTSGAHMGPGTWALAFLPGAFNQEQLQTRVNDGL
ncbi:MAG: DegV family protein [Syntrophobacteraceae bacterium]